MRARKRPDDHGAATEVLRNSGQPHALQHTATGGAGSFHVTVYQGEAALLIAVKDDGSDKIPLPSPADALAEDGRGLGLVELIASRWGHCTDEHGRTIWFELRWNGLNRPDP
jgi:hypothetical protein